MGTCKAVAWIVRNEFSTLYRSKYFSKMVFSKNLNRNCEPIYFKLLPAAVLKITLELSVVFLLAIALSNIYYLLQFLEISKQNGVLTKHADKNKLRGLLAGIEYTFL